MVERGGLENHCRHCLPGVRIPPPPPTILKLAAYVLLLLLHTQAALAQLQYLRYDPAARPLGTRYLVHQTPHFDVIFEASRIQEAAEAARLLEQELDKTQSLIGRPRLMHMPVVLNAYNDRSNGYVHTLPFRQEIEVPHIRGDILSPHYSSWMKAVVPHELVHAVQAQSGGQFGVGTVLNWIAPDLARSTNMALPPGLNEGAAVYYESQVQPNAGRLHDSRFQMKMKAALEASKPWSLAQLFEAPAYTWPRDRHYIGGANFFAWQVGRDGGAFFRRMRHRLWRFPFRATGRELRRATGEPVNKLSSEFREDLLEAIAQWPQENESLSKLKMISGRTGLQHRRPYWASDSTLIVYKQGYDVISGLYAVDVHTGASQHLHAVRLPEDAWYSLVDSTVLYSRYVRDTFVPTQWVAEAYEFDLRTRQPKRLTTDGRVFAPVQVGNSIWAVKNEGQYNVISSIGPDGAVTPLQPELKITVTQVAPAPDGNRAAVVIRSQGEQGIYRAEWVGQREPTLEPWITLPGNAIREVSWSPDGRFLLFTTDLSGPTNVYSYDLERDRTTQLTSVRYGALDPQVSPDGRTLVFVNYEDERYDLVSIPFAPESALELSLPNRVDALPLQPVDSVPSGFATEPYSIGGRLAPRLVLPIVRYDYTSPREKLGMGVGLWLMGSDPLRRMTYSTRLSVQSSRLWGSASLSTMLGIVQTTAYVYRRPNTVTAAVREADGRTRSLIYGRNQENVGLQFRMPLYLESNVRNTSGVFRLGLEAGQESWFAIDENPVPVLVSSGESLARRFGFTAVNAGVAFNIRQMRNSRDIWPHRGGAFSISTHSDMWHEMGQVRRALLGRAALYWSPSRHAHTGMRMGVTVLSQNRANVFDAFLIMPRTHEDAYVDAGNTVKADVEFIQPLWFIDDGFLNVPMYFKVLYVYSFLEAIVHSDTPQVRNSQAVGAGVGLEWRVMHYLDLDIRIGLVYPNTGGLMLTFR